MTRKGTENKKSRIKKHESLPKWHELGNDSV